MAHKLIALALLCLVSALDEQPPRTELETIVIEFAQPIHEWVGFNTSALEVARQCNLDALESPLLALHSELAAAGEHFTRAHIDVIRKVFRENAQVKGFFNCVVGKSNTQNQFIKQPKKYKYLAQYIKQHEFMATEMFYQDDKPIDKGYRLGRFFRAFFEYYYQYVLHPAETVSTKLIRAMTTKIQLFGHEDISNCLSLQTSGKLSQSLQNLGIYNIYLNVPQAFNAIKYMKFKDKCKTDKYSKMLSQIHETLQDIDMFKIMYHDYNPWVEIAAQKDGNKQIEYISRIFAKIINNQDYYEEISRKTEDDL